MTGPVLIHAPPDKYLILVPGVGWWWTDAAADATPFPDAAAAREWVVHNLGLGVTTACVDQATELLAHPPGWRG